MKKNVTSFNKKPSILMFPWLAHGHISPYLELAKKLAERNFNIYLCTTSATLSSVRNKLDSYSSRSTAGWIRFVELWLPIDVPGPPLLPEDHTTNGLQCDRMDVLKRAFNKSSSNFYDILDELKPDLLIYDFLQPWAPMLAKILRIPVVEFITSSATMTAFSLHDAMYPGTKFPYSAIYERDYEILKRAKEGKSRESMAEDRRPILQSHSRADLILVKSFKEIEAKYCGYLSQLLEKKILPVGPLVQDPTNDDDYNPTSVELLEWLDQKHKCSTVFIAFGSEYFLSKKDILEIAHGLDLSDANFIWVLRFPKGLDVELDAVLPEGFFNKVGDRGKVIKGWAPQAKILNHFAIGGFVSHCGWSSIMESMKFGVPIIAMPMHIDQPINARLVEEVGVGLEVVRDIHGIVDRMKIADVIEKVLNVDTCVKKKAEWISSEIEKNGEKEIDGLVKVLWKLICIARTRILAAKTRKDRRQRPCFYFS